MTHEERALTVLKKLFQNGAHVAQSYQEQERDIAMLAREFEVVEDLNPRSFDVWRVNYVVKSQTVNKYFSSKSLAEDFQSTIADSVRMAHRATHHRGKLYVLDEVPEGLSDDAQKKVVRERVLSKLTAAEIEILGLRELV